MPATWNLWHGCRKISDGCTHCYVYRMDGSYGKNPSQIRKTTVFDLPVRKDRTGCYKIPSGELVYTCFTSDFLLEEADAWREEAWSMMRERWDLNFLFITKRIHRIQQCLPKDWGNGYENVRICCTVENQEQADFRLPFFLEAPIRHRSIICEPLLGSIHLFDYLGGWIDEVIVGGESGMEARVCDYAWVLDLREQCRQKQVDFSFRQTGARLRKGNVIHRIQRKSQHSQARKAGIDLCFSRGKEKML